MSRRIRLLFFVLYAVAVAALPPRAAFARDKTVEVGAETSTRDAFDHLWAGLSKFDRMPDASEFPDVTLENGTNGFCAAKALHKARQTMFLAKLGPAITRSMSMTLDLAKILVPLGGAENVGELLIEYLNSTDLDDFGSRMKAWFAKKGVSEGLKMISNKLLEEWLDDLMPNWRKPKTPPQFPADRPMPSPNELPPTDLDENAIVDFVAGKIVDAIFEKLNTDLAGIKVDKTDLNGCDATVIFQFAPPTKTTPGQVIVIVDGDCHCGPPDASYPHLGKFHVAVVAPLTARTEKTAGSIKILLGIGTPTYRVNAQCDDCGDDHRTVPPSGGPSTTPGGVVTPPKVDERVCPICAEYHPAVHEARADKLDAEANAFDDDAKKRRSALDEVNAKIADAEARRAKLEARMASMTKDAATKQALAQSIQETQAALDNVNALLASLAKTAAGIADEIAADGWLAQKRRKDADAERAEAKKEREAMEKCEKEKCHPKTIGMIDLRVGGAFDVTKEDDQVAVGADACFAIPGAPILDACFSPRIQTGGGSTILQLPAAAQLEVPITPQVVFAPRLGIGWSLQTFGAFGSIGSLLVMPEVGGKYLVNDKVEIGADVASLPMYINDTAFQAQYRAMVYGGFRL